MLGESFSTPHSENHSELFKFQSATRFELTDVFLYHLLYSPVVQRVH